jgi:hypothetical protein
MYHTPLIYVSFRGIFVSNIGLQGLLNIGKYIFFNVISPGSLQNIFISLQPLKTRAFSFISKFDLVYQLGILGIII